MSRQLSERELKRVNRTLSGHARDKDRQRWKRKVSGQAAPKASRRDEVGATDDPFFELDEAATDEDE